MNVKHVLASEPFRPLQCSDIAVFLQKFVVLLGTFLICVPVYTVFAIHKWFWSGFDTAVRVPSTNILILLCKDSLFSCEMCGRANKNEGKFVFQDVPLLSITWIRALKVYLRSHLNLGVVTSVNYFYSTVHRKQMVIPFASYHSFNWIFSITC